MFGAFMARLKEWQRARNATRELERSHLSPEELRFSSESVDDRQAEIGAEARFGGVEPGRLLEDDTPAHD